MTSKERTKLLVVLSEQGYVGYHYGDIRVKLQDCPDLETAVGVCVDENYSSLAAAIRKAAGLDASVGAYGTAQYNFVFTEEEREILDAYKAALAAKDELNPAPFEDAMRDINKNYAPGLESIMRKLTGE